MRLQIRELRDRYGWSQEELAHRVGMNRSTISQIENDRHGWTSATLRLFASVFSVPEHEVLGYQHPPEAQLTPETVEAIALLERLTPTGRKIALGQLRVLAQADCGVETPEPNERS